MTLVTNHQFISNLSGFHEKQTQRKTLRVECQFAMIGANNLGFSNIWMNYGIHIHAIGLPAITIQSVRISIQNSCVKALQALTLLNNYGHKTITG